MRRGGATLPPCSRLPREPRPSHASEPDRQPCAAAHGDAIFPTRRGDAKASSKAQSTAACLASAKSVAGGLRASQRRFGARSRPDSPADMRSTVRWFFENTAQVSNQATLRAASSAIQHPGSPPETIFRQQDARTRPQRGSRATSTPCFHSLPARRVRSCVAAVVYSVQQEAANQVHGQSVELDAAQQIEDDIAQNFGNDAAEHVDSLQNEARSQWVPV